MDIQAHHENITVIVNESIGDVLSGTIVSIGEGVPDTGLRVGDQVFVGKYAGHKIEKYTIVHFSQIFAKHG